MTAAKLNRTTFATSRLLDFCSEKELVAQTGHRREAWPMVIIKELMDNSLDACEEAAVAPEVSIVVDDHGITVKDNGPGIPSDTIAGMLDFSIRVSSREAYVAPDRGAQGNALKTIVAMPFVLDGEVGEINIQAQGIRHAIKFRVDHIRQEPVIDHAQDHGDVNNGTEVHVQWPDLACSILHDAKVHFLQIADDYTWLNPHLTLDLDWFGERHHTAALDVGWKKWLPSDPTPACWYDQDRFERLIAGYIAHDADTGRERTVRELVSEFRGLSGSAKQKAVLDATGLSRATVASLNKDSALDSSTISALLDAMKAHSKPVKPAALGTIGKDNLLARFRTIEGFEPDSFQYRKILDTEGGIPTITETAFGWIDSDDMARRLVTGVNWSPGILNPFREIGTYGDSLDTLLTRMKSARDEPIILVLHCACPRVEYTDRGKSAVVVS
jgi:DNA topoisomerase VI subunit B